MRLVEVAAELDALERRRDLEDPSNLRAREEALYLLAFLADTVRAERRDAAAQDLVRRADALRMRLEEATDRLVGDVRARLCAGTMTPATLRRTLDLYTDYRGGREAESGSALHLRYEPIDVLVGALVGAEDPIEETRPREPGMIHLEFTPTSVVLELVDRAGLAADDLFVDLGAGLGQVVMLVHLLTGVRVLGVEREPAYCARATHIAGELRLTGVQFVCADARKADIGAGSLFYLFTPFVGQILQQVLDRLQAVAQRHRVRVATYGACTVHVAGQGWLRSTDGNAGHEFRLALFESR